MKIKKRIRFERPYVNKAYRFMFEPGYIPKKYNIIYGGTGSSKSFTIHSKFIEMCLTHKTFDILIVRKVGTTLYDTVQTPLEHIMTRNFRNRLSGNGLKEGRDYTYNRTLKYIRFATGSIIRFKSYDDPEKLKGIDNVNVLWLEEATDFTESDLEDIQDRLRSPVSPNHPWGQELKIFLSFNPIFKTHWIRKYFFEDEIDMSNEIHKDIVKGPEITFALKTTWRDNKFYNGPYKNEKIRSKVKKNNPRKYGVQCNGNWGVLGELIYENWKVIQCEKDLHWYDDISAGLDFGFGHHTAFHLVGAKGEDIYALKEYYKPQVTVNDIIRDLKKMFPDVSEIAEEFKNSLNDEEKKQETMCIFKFLKLQYAAKTKLEIFNKEDLEPCDIDIKALCEQIQDIIGVTYTELQIYGDNARPEAIEEMRRQGFSGIKPCTKGANSVLEGIEWLQDRIIYVDESCTGLRNELDSYQWDKDKKTGERLPKPVKVNDDAVDSLRYSTEPFKNPHTFFAEWY